MTDLLADVRHALRLLVRSPGPAVAIVVTLAVGIGGTTAVFSVVDQVLLRPFAFDAERIVDTWFDIPARNRTDWTLSNETYDLLDRSMRSVTDLAAVSTTYRTLGLPGEDRRVAGAQVSASFFDVVGMAPVAGRAFTAEEDRVGGPRVAMIGEGLWRRELGADPAIPGSTVELDGEPFTVVGVFPDEVRIVERLLEARGVPTVDNLEIYTPVAPLRATLAPHTYVYTVLGRLAPGVTLDEARTELDGLTDELHAVATVDTLVPRVDSLRNRITGGPRPILLVLLGAAAGVLAIVCANVSALLAVRASRRSREWAVRRALGGGAGRIARQLVTEGVVVAALGGALGLGLAGWLLSLLRSTAATTIPRLEALALDPRVLGLTLLVTVVAGLSFGLLPAAVFARRPPAAALTTRDAALTRRGRRGLQALVAAEVGLAVILTIGTVALTRSLAHLLDQDPGYEAEGVLTMTVDLPALAYPGDGELGRYAREALDELAGIPGITAAGIISGPPLMAPAIAMSTDGPDGPVRLSAREASVTPALFDALGTRLLEGRGIEPADDAAAPRVVVVSRTLADQLWPGESAVGKRLDLGSWRNFQRTGMSTPVVSREVVGVVEDFRSLGMGGGDAAPHVFMPFAQAPWARAVFMVRTPGDPAALAPTATAAVRAVDPDLPVWDVEPLQAAVARASERERFGTGVVFGFAVVSFGLALVGIYGVVSYTVVLRTRELGVRAALGARPAGLVALVLRSGLLPVAAGLFAGLGATLAGAGVLRSLVYQVDPTDPAVLLLTSAAVAIVTTAATWIPARRAARLDPVAALRSG